MVIIGPGRQRRREQRLCIRMLWRFKNCFRRSGFHHFAEIHDCDAISEIAGGGKIVGHEDIAKPVFALQILEQVYDLGPNRDVEARYRLVQNDEVCGG